MVVSVFSKHSIFLNWLFFLVLWVKYSDKEETTVNLSGLEFVADLKKAIVDVLKLNCSGPDLKLFQTKNTQKLELNNPRQSVQEINKSFTIEVQGNYFICIHVLFRRNFFTNYYLI